MIQRKIGQVPKDIIDSLNEVRHNTFADWKGVCYQMELRPGTDLSYYLKQKEITRYNKCYRLSSIYKYFDDEAKVRILYAIADTARWTDAEKEAHGEYKRAKAMT